MGAVRCGVALRAIVGRSRPRQKLKPARFTVGRCPPHSCPMPDAPDPPRKFYTFKPVDFENVNGVRPASSLHDTQPLPDPGIIVSDKVRIDVRDLARAATSQPLLSSAPAPMRKNEVHTVLRDNLANAAGLNDLTLDPHSVSPQQRRVRRFWLVIFAFNMPLGALAWWIGHEQAIPFVCTVGSIGFVTGRLVWKTFFLNTD